MTLLLRKRRACAIPFLLVLALSACEAGPGLRDRAESEPAERASPEQVQAIAVRFAALVNELEQLVFPPQRVSISERRRLRLAMGYVVDYLEARDWREERIVQLERERWKLQRAESGLYDDDRAAYVRLYENHLASLARIDTEIARLRSLPAADAGAESPLVELPSASGERTPDARPRPRVYGDRIAEMEALLAPPGRLHPQTKTAFRRRLEPLLAFLDVPLSRAEQIDELKNQLAVLQRFDHVPPLDGTNELYVRYRQAIEAEAAQLRERIRRLESDDH